MKTHAILWAFVALGFAFVVQVLGPYIIGAALTYGLYRFLKRSEQP